MDYGDESDYDIISTEMLENIHDGIKSYLNVNIREDRYKILGRIRLIQLEWKGALKYTKKMGKGLHKILNTSVKEILQNLPSLV